MLLTLMTLIFLPLTLSFYQQNSNYNNNNYKNNINYNNNIYTPKPSLTLNCVFTSDLQTSTYDCISINTTIRERSQSFYTFDGNHIQNRTNFDVNGLKISSQICHFMPSNLGGLIPNLKRLEISYSGLNEVDSSEFAYLIFLNYLNLRGNRIEILPFGLLAANRDLISVDFSDNFIRIVAQDFFNYLEKLKFADFGNNFCVKEAPSGENLREWEREIRRNCNGAESNKEIAQPLWRIVERIDGLRSVG